jgi:CRP-like cAMP-binding protein
LNAWRVRFTFGLASSASLLDVSDIQALPPQMGASGALKEGKPEPIVGKISQETLAEMIGTTRARVSFFMNKFRKLGFIEYNGKLEVHSSLLNMVLHEKPEIKPTDEAIGGK